MNHLLENIIPRSLETALYKIGDWVPFTLDNELCYAQITGITERGGELAYEVIVKSIQSFEDTSPNPGFEYWIFQSQIIKLQ